MCGKTTELERGPFHPQAGQPFVRNQVFENRDIVNEDFQPDLDMIVVDVDFGDVGCDFGAGQVDPVGVGGFRYDQCAGDDQ